MKKFLTDFMRRGLVGSGFGPLILAILYLIINRCSGLETLTVKEVCIGIFSITALAFVAGGMNAVYQIERLPLMVAISIHGGTLYVSYLATYLVNNWLEWGAAPILVFSGVFVLGYLVIWAIIYSITRKNADKLNAALKRKQEAVH